MKAAFVVVCVFVASTLAQRESSPDTEKFKQHFADERHLLLRLPQLPVSHLPVQYQLLASSLPPLTLTRQYQT